MKVFIITLRDNPKSVATAELTRESAIYNAGYEPVLVAAMDGKTGRQYLEANNIQLRHGYPEHRPGAIGCIASHIVQWLGCIELNETIIVAEHDAVFLRPWDNPEFEDVLHLNCYGSYVRANTWAEATANDRSATVQENSVYRMGFEPFDFPGSVSMSTTFAYAIKPHAALKLINSVLQDGYCFADRLMEEPLISIETVHPPLAQEQLTCTMSTTS